MATSVEFFYNTVLKTSRPLTEREIEEFGTRLQERLEELLAQPQKTVENGLSTLGYTSRLTYPDTKLLKEMGIRS